MNKKIIYFILIFLLSCSSQEKTLKVEKIIERQPPDILYKNAIVEFDKGEYQKALNILKSIVSENNFSNFNPKSFLMISFIYYDSNEYLLSLEYLKKFKELYPAHKNISYAEFLTGLCFYEQINIISKDQTPSLLALDQFNSIISKYPKSIYAKESKLKIDLIYEQLAGHEMYLARYYIKKQKWGAAIFRLQTIIEKYQNTIFIAEALHRMVEIYYKLGNIQLAKKYAAILGYNFNNSEWYKKTYKITADKNYSIEKLKNKKSFTDKLLRIFNFRNND